MEPLSLAHQCGVKVNLRNLREEICLVFVEIDCHLQLHSCIGEENGNRGEKGGWREGEGRRERRERGGRGEGRRGWKYRGEGR